MSINKWNSSFADVVLLPKHLWRNIIFLYILTQLHMFTPAPPYLVETNPLKEHGILVLQNYRDAPNHPNFPSAVLTPGQLYQHKVPFSWDLPFNHSHTRKYLCLKTFLKNTQPWRFKQSRCRYEYENKKIVQSLLQVRIFFKYWLRRQIDEIQVSKIS
jgi:hypothetical protein